MLLLFSCQVVSDFFATPWTVARQAPLSLGFSRQMEWSAISLSRDLPTPEIKPTAPALSGEFLYH